MPSVAYAPPLPGFLPAEEVPHPEFAGQVALRLPNGCYVCVTPAGQVEERCYPQDGAQPGGWEAFEPHGTYYLARREGNIFVLPRAA